MSSKSTKRIVIALVSLLAVSAAFAWGGYPEMPDVGRLSTVRLDAASEWMAAQLSAGAWQVAAAVGLMAIICKRRQKN